MSRFNYLGHPTVDEINDLNQYLDVKYDLIPQQKKALQHEIDNLKVTLAKYLAAEAIAARETRKSLLILLLQLTSKTQSLQKTARILKFINTLQ